MIVSRQKPLTEILTALETAGTVFLVGCAKCATVCKAGGEEEIWRMQEQLTAAGKEVTGSIVIDEVCHMLRTQRDLRSKKGMVDEAEAILVLACGAGVQSVAEAGPKRVVPGLDTLFLGNIRRFGHFEQRCSLCGECVLDRTAGICPVTTCPKGILNGPCGGMENGMCESDAESECAWYRIWTALGKDAGETAVASILPPKDHRRKKRPARLKLDR